MAADDLVQASEISGFPGAPFDAAILTAAGDTIRSACGWHIAPTRPETLRVRSCGGRDIYVDTLHLVSVAEIRDVTDSTAVVLDGYTFDTDGRIYCADGWPAGHRELEVDVTHGYTACPPDLLPIVAAAARGATPGRTVASKTLGGATIAYAAGTDASATLERHTLVTV